MARVTVNATEWARIEGDAEKWLERILLQAERRAKRLCAVDTGRLRSSITHTVIGHGDSLQGLLFSDVEYSLWLEIGTRYMAARPYLRPALHQALAAT